MHKQTNTSTNTTNCQLWAIDSGDFDQKYESPSPEFPKDWAVTDMGCAGFHCVAKYIFQNILFSFHMQQILCSLDWKMHHQIAIHVKSTCLYTSTQTTGYSVEPNLISQPPKQSMYKTCRHLSAKVASWRYIVCHWELKGRRFLGSDGAIVHWMLQHGQPSNFFILSWQCFPTQRKSWQKAHENSLDGFNRAELLSKTSILLVIPSRQATNVKWDFGFPPKMEIS